MSTKKQSNKDGSNWIQNKLKNRKCHSYRTYPIMTKITGSKNAGIMLAQLAYWYTRSGTGTYLLNGVRLPKNTIYKDSNDWHDEVELSKKQVTAGNKLLKAMRFNGEPVVEINPAPPRRQYYSLYPDRMIGLIDQMTGYINQDSESFDDAETVTELTPKEDQPRQNVALAATKGSGSHDKREGLATTKGRGYNSNYPVTTTATTADAVAEVPSFLKELFDDDNILNDVFSACGTPARARDLCDRAGKKRNPSGWILDAIYQGYAFPKDSEAHICGVENCNRPSHMGNTSGYLCKEHYPAYRQIKDRNLGYSIKDHIRQENEEAA